MIAITIEDRDSTTVEIAGFSIDIASTGDEIWADIYNASTDTLIATAYTWGLGIFQINITPTDEGVAVDIYDPADTDEPLDSTYAMTSDLEVATA